MYTYFIEGGMMMWLLAALSIMGLGTILERTAYFIKNEQGITREFKEEIVALVRAGKEKEAIELCDKTNNSVSRTVKSILLAYKNENDLYESKEKLMKEKALEQIENLERRLSILGIVAYISPMAGLNGKVEEIILLDNFTSYGFRKEVEKALKKWEFDPIIYHGEKIKLYFYKDFRFNVK